MRFKVPSDNTHFFKPHTGFKCTAKLVPPTPPLEKTEEIPIYIPKVKKKLKKVV